jgi:transcriptional regulator with XRE-family HTH domain
MNTQSKAIRKALKQKSWSQREFARRLGVSEAHVSYVLSGERRIGRRYILAVSRMLGVPVEDLLS